MIAYDINPKWVVFAEQQTEIIDTIGEQVFCFWLRENQIPYSYAGISDPEFDVQIEGYRIDCLSTFVIQEPSNDAVVLISGNKIIQDTDLYVFLGVNFKQAWMMGWIHADDFWTHPDLRELKVSESVCLDMKHLRPIEIFAHRFRDA